MGHLTTEQIIIACVFGVPILIAALLCLALVSITRNIE